MELLPGWSANFSKPMVEMQQLVLLRVMADDLKCASTAKRSGPKLRQGESILA